ncbi:hypothetical protein HanRHA438_Chr03g0137681 [Helianthus annuus]|nr:hypothetical protein HanRHA438_Chr03g0137681 [Helianthus annuus]
MLRPPPSTPSRHPRKPPSATSSRQRRQPPSANPTRHRRRPPPATPSRTRSFFTASVPATAAHRGANVISFRNSRFKITPYMSKV